MKLSAERLRCLLDYDPHSGVFRWRCRPNRRIRPGSVAGTINHGRLQIRIDGRTYRAHRLAWLYAIGKWPIGEIDHINGDPRDNRLRNLRDVPRTINLQNKHRPQRRNVLGVLGVSPTKSGRFRARIDGRHIGTYATPEAAQAAYFNAKRETHPESTVWQK